MVPFLLGCLLSLSLAIPLLSSIGAHAAAFGPGATVAMDRLIQCSYNFSAGTFVNEGLWQTANSLETISAIVAHNNNTPFLKTLRMSFEKTEVLMDHCYDDWQWWLQAWVRAYGVDQQTMYIQRAADIFEQVIKNWSPVCGGGLFWCPGSTYKNAITNELFLVSSMLLHPFASVLGRPQDYYLSWAKREWAWFEASGMVNAEGMINDGLTSDCKNNGQTTWTYNQGVLLDGLAMLHRATGNASLLAVAESLLRSSMRALAVSGTVTEPCGTTCGQDGLLFKGIYMRHVRYLAGFITNATFLAEIDAFQVSNAASIVANDVCDNGYFGMQWAGPCQQAETPSMSSGIDALWAASLAAPTQLHRDPTSLNLNLNLNELRPHSGPESLVERQSVRFNKPQPLGGSQLLGLGKCVDSAGQTMPSCVGVNVTEADCARAMATDASALAYDFTLGCSGGSLCSVRTLSAGDACEAGWRWVAGSARSVARADNTPLTVCVVKGQA